MMNYHANRCFDTLATIEPEKRPFASLQQFKEAQAALHHRYHQHGAQADILADIATFIERVRATGRQLAAASDRFYAQTILDYWANKLYRADWPEPDATLADYRTEASTRNRQPVNYQI